MWSTLFEFRQMHPSFCSLVFKVLLNEIETHQEGDLPHSHLEMEEAQIKRQLHNALPLELILNVILCL